MPDVNTNQAIFDAIVAATRRVPSIDAMRVEITIDTQKFIDTFNNHRDRKLCTSLDIAPTKEP